MGQEGGQQRQTRAVWSEKYMILRGKVGAGMRVMAACF